MHYSHRQVTASETIGWGLLIGAQAYILRHTKCETVADEMRSNDIQVQGGGVEARFLLL